MSKLTGPQVACSRCGKPPIDGAMVNDPADMRRLAHADCLPIEQAIEMADMAYVYNELRQQMSALPESDHPAFLAKANPVIQLARYIGIFAALSWMDADESDIRDQLARVEESQLAASDTDLEAPAR